MITLTRHLPHDINVYEQAADVMKSFKCPVAIYRDSDGLPHISAMNHDKWPPMPVGYKLEVIMFTDDLSTSDMRSTFAQAAQAVDLRQSVAVDLRDPPAYLHHPNNI